MLLYKVESCKAEQMEGDGQLKYSEIEVKKMLKDGDLSLEDQIKSNLTS